MFKATPLFAPLFAVAAAALAATPALAQSTSDTSEFAVIGNVPALCSGGTISGANATFDLGVLVNTSTGLLRTDLSAPSKVITGSFCSARSTINVDADVFIADEKTSAQDVYAFLQKIGGERFAGKIVRKLASAYEDAGRYKRAVEAYELLRKLEPTSPEGTQHVLAIARAWVIERDDAKILATYQRLLDEHLPSGTPVYPAGDKAVPKATPATWAKTQLDPKVVEDGNRKWIYYGSYGGGVYVQPLRFDGLQAEGTPRKVGAAWRYEGAEVVRHGGWWYLFGSTTDCCNGPLTGLRVGVLHGRLAPEEKDRTMRAFAAGDLDVLVSTTVIEVGVDVANATAMVILDADRFGVSQLHQLRGRVGRGGLPGLCLLVTHAELGSPARERLDAVAGTTDGFALSQVDLELRREGDILGASQSGRFSSS